MSLLSSVLTVFIIPSVLCQCGVPLHNSKIVGGEDVGRYLYPWFALLELKDKNIAVCAGSLITDYHVLSAAHCFSIFPGTPKEDLYRVKLGAYNRCDTKEKTQKNIEVASVAIHEKYKSGDKFYDIALMTLKSSAETFTKVCLPTPGHLSTQEPALLIGFGVTKEGNMNLPCHMREARVTKFTRSQCRKTQLPREDIQEPSVFCAGVLGGHVDSCQGDSGGPLMTITHDGRYMISGIVSYGYGCGNPGLPGIYTDVATYLGWINQRIKRQPNHRLKNVTILEIAPVKFTPFNQLATQHKMQFIDPFGRVIVKTGQVKFPST